MDLKPEVGMTVVIDQGPTIPNIPAMVCAVGVDWNLDLLAFTMDTMHPVPGIPWAGSDRADMARENEDFGGVWDFTERDKQVAAILTPNKKLQKAAAT